jgi:anti-sigma factor RsiW
MHAQYTELMSLVLDGEAAPGDREALFGHLRECSACSALWASWQRLDAGLREAPMVAPPPGFARRVAVRIEQRNQRRAWLRWLGTGAIAAWLSIALFAWLFAVSVALWGFTHPQRAGTVLSAAARALSLALWPMRGVELASAVTGLPVWAGVGVCLALIGLLFGLWLWLALRRPAFAPARSQ